MIGSVHVFFRELLVMILLFFDTELTFKSQGLQVCKELDTQFSTIFFLEINLSKIRCGTNVDTKNYIENTSTSRRRDFSLLNQSSYFKVLFEDKSIFLASEINKSTILEINNNDKKGVKVASLEIHIPPILVLCIN